MYCVLSLRCRFFKSQGYECEVWRANQGTRAAVFLFLPVSRMPNEPSRDATLWVVLGFAWRLGYSIAVPLVVMLAAGRWLDKKYGTSPWLLITGLVLSFILTNILMFREAFRVMKETNEENNEVKARTNTEEPNSITNI